MRNFASSFHNDGFALSTCNHGQGLLLTQMLVATGPWSSPHGACSAHGRLVILSLMVALPELNNTPMQTRG